MLSTNSVWKIAGQPTGLGRPLSPRPVRFPAMRRLRTCRLVSLPRYVRGIDIAPSVSPSYKQCLTHPRLVVNVADG